MVFARAFRMVAKTVDFMLMALYDVSLRLFSANRYYIYSRSSIDVPFFVFLFVSFYGAQASKSNAKVNYRKCLTAGEIVCIDVTDQSD